MTTKKLHIRKSDDPKYIEMKQKRYSWAFKELYKRIEESADKSFQGEFMGQFKLNDIEYRTLVSEVKSFKEKEQTTWEKKKQRVRELKEKLESGKLSKKNKIKTIQKIDYLSMGIGRESTFGGRTLQQKLTREHNKAEKDLEKIKKLTKEFKQNRIRPFVIMGEANQGGNRFFDFSNLVDGIIIYKPHKGKRITLEITVPKNWKNELKVLAEKAESKEISVTVKLSNTGLHLSYDNEKLSGFEIDVNSRKKEVDEVKRQDHPEEIKKNIIKDIYLKYGEEQRERKLQGKIPGRCIAVDLNPTAIGYSILDRKDNGQPKIVTCGVLDLTYIKRKSGKASDDEKSKYLVNKRKYETSMVVKWLFELASQYRCSSFVVEDLNVRNTNLGSRESNRKVNNIWNRGLTISLIKRRCEDGGVGFVEVNPCYSSFIGNIKYKYSDPCNASIEIGRRGLYKFIKNGKLYPEITLKDRCTLESVFGYVVTDARISWVEIYKSLRSSYDEMEFSRRLRTGLDEVTVSHTDFSMSSCRSGVKVHFYN